MDNGKNYYENSNSIVTMGVGDKALRLITKEIRDDITSNYPFTKIVGKPTMHDYLTLINDASAVAVQQETGSARKEFNSEVRVGKLSFFISQIS